MIGKPEFQSEKESCFWEETLHAALRGGMGSINAVQTADYSLHQLRSRQKKEDKTTN